MNNEDIVIEGSGNVFADLGYPNAEEQQTKAKLVSQIAKLIERQRLTQTDAATRLGIDQPKVSAMLAGRFRGFSVYRLMCFIAALGGEVEIVTRAHNNHTTQSERIAVRYTPPALSPLPTPSL
jgi:predicted XRE-type DNA-binding protein